MLYFVNKPKFFRKFYGDCTWEIKTNEKVLYLTFDDGPEPESTDFVLALLKRYHAKATFFCIGKKAEAHPQTVEKITSEGHALGNHTYSHYDGWKTPNKVYFNDIKIAEKSVSTNLFRPPYGHITRRMAKILMAPPYSFKIVLWNVLSADFDPEISPEKCFKNVIRYASPGAIVLFHDTAAASQNLQFALPRILDHYSQRGYKFQKLA